VGNEQKKEKRKKRQAQREEESRNHNTGNIFLLHERGQIGEAGERRTEEVAASWEAL